MSGSFRGVAGAAEALRQSGLLSAADLERADRLAIDRSIPLDGAAVALGLLTEDQALFVVAERNGVDLVFPTADGVDRELVARFPAELLRRHDALPMLLEDEGAVVAFAELPKREVLAELAKCAAVHVRPVLAARRRLRLALDQVVGGGADAARVSAHDFSGMTAFYRRLTAAFCLGADELRFEPGPSEIRVRVRRRGAELISGTEPLSVAAGVAARARMLSCLPTPDAPAPQTADFTMRVAGREIALRLSILPGPEGEVVVLRRRAPCVLPTSLAEYGLPDDVLAACRGPGLVAVAASERRLANAFARALLLDAPTSATRVAVTDDRSLEAAVGVRVAPTEDATATLARARPDFLFVDAGDDERLAALAARAAGTGATVIVAVADDVPEDALVDLAHAAGARRFARALAAAVVLEHAPALCRACSRPVTSASAESAGWRLPGGCGKCGRTGEDGTVVVAAGVVADADVRARVRSGRSPLPPEESDVPERWSAPVREGRVARADAKTRTPRGNGR